MLFVLDNYDSFTYNLVQYLGELGAEPAVYRNDAVTVEEVLALKPEGRCAFTRSLHAIRCRHFGPARDWPWPARSPSSASAWATRRLARHSVARWCGPNG